MDLVQTVRKEGSRGGRAEFKWEDVKTDAQRENYLGHSLMAPVGRWQNGRDLNWYARGDDPDPQSAAEKLAQEKRRIKEAEEDAMLAAMGLPVPTRGVPDANLTPLGKKASDADVERAMAEIAAEDGPEERAKGVGYNGYSGRAGAVPGGEGDVLEGQAWRDPDRSKRERSRDRRDRHSDRNRGHKKRRPSRSRSRERYDRRRDRSRSREKRRHRDHDRHGYRSRSRDRRQRDEDRHPRRYADDERPQSKEQLQRRRSRSPDNEYRKRRY
ncbi:uncharacterized protein BDR25DRAFT_303335 [Lindgomyces ingoldianus]|uniref:Uncharacterized protein n=1 Tax=Lindgomyces ingoldianus TaxID=673940 RepID=A0ACB6QW46_9PLEO|nr:uncharacterized protein BDR25DRAFT_303335 [Lindgomyces ingoldianus]KAF2471274.1 hypothetical protein BDR25DRAFT_303335 [Lindgomyces ingoldianus]